ncbi:MAG: adenylate/guanylate cyclase domain-containing protein [Deltaproteobacteria bacterium]|nr:adenylate/guanylate cyclase domain-containing protein [Deltaproteobacteria bacterium]
MKPRRGPIARTLFIAAAAAGVAFAAAGWLEGIDSAYGDLWHNLAGRRAEPRHVAIVSIDDQTLLDHKDEPLVFWGPHFARVIEVVRKAGAKVIGVDFLFSVSAESWLKRLDLPESDKSRTYDVPFREQIAPGGIVLIGLLAGEAADVGRLLLPIDDYQYVLPGGRNDVGLANLHTDPDGVVRRYVTAVFDDGTQPAATFGALLAAKAAGIDPSRREWNIGGVRLDNGLSPRTIAYMGRPGTVPRIPFGQLLPKGAENTREIEVLKGKVVIIAAEHVGNQDVHLTPYSLPAFRRGERMMSGAEIHANIVESLLSGRNPRPVNAWLRAMAVLAAVVLGTALFFSLGPVRGLLAGTAIAAACALLSYLGFRWDKLLSTAVPQAGLALSYLATLALRLTGEERERARLRKMFGQYVSDDVVELLLSKGHPNLGGESKPVTVLFSDIRNFTSISEKLKAPEVVEMLNTYFSRVCEQIYREGGTVDKFIGDAIMAVFGSPVEYTDHAARAIRTAIAMAETAKEFKGWMAKRFAGRDLPEFNIGVGIHTGEAVLGNVGSPKRMEFTAVGDTVNTASRLEGKTKEMQCVILASADTVKQVGAGVRTGKTAVLNVKGKNEPVEVFEVLGMDEARSNL